MSTTPPAPGSLPTGRVPSTLPAPPLGNLPAVAASSPAIHGEAELEPLPAEEVLSAAPAWLVSAIVHMAIVIILGLFMIPREQALEFLLSFSGDDQGEDLTTADLDASLDASWAAPEEAWQTESAVLLEEGTLNATTSTEEPTPTISSLLPAGQEPAIGLALSGRVQGRKETLLQAYGGTAGTEQAVTEALRWLLRNQTRDIWHLTGPYSDGALRDNPEAATALALLAFQGAGYTPQSDRKSPFTQATAKGWKSLLKRQDEYGNFFHEGAGNTALYTQALCTIALCELYAMTQDSLYREPAQRAVDYCVKTQDEDGGGWRYNPGDPGDLSVTGWFVMGLQSARMAGLDVPKATLGRVGDFLDSVSHDAGAQYSYLPGQDRRLSMTAEGLLCRQYLGWPRDEDRLQRGVDVLLAHLPGGDSDERDSYYWYYAAQVCHHMEGSRWRTWNQAMRRVVPALQVREGKERGSWNPSEDMGRGAAGGGRLFVTCLHAYMLEVYYRHLPIYQLPHAAGR